MKNTKFLCAISLGMALAFFSTLSVGKEANREWMTSACYKFRLAAWDKFNGPAWDAKYVITSSKGRVFVAERHSDSDSNDFAVSFPDDFHDEKAPDINASVDCFWGDTYTWKIYVNGKLRDSGTIGFHRNKPRY